MKHFFPLLLCGLTGLQATTTVWAKSANGGAATKLDTVKVSSAELTGCFPLRRPFATDSVNLADRPFDPAEVLEQNALIAKKRGQQSLSRLTTGAAIDSNAVSVLRFTVDTERWRTARLQTPQLKRYDTFLNGVKVTDGNLRFWPGRSEVTLMVYADRHARDTFNVSLTGDSLNVLRTNVTDQRKFAFDDMVHGKRYYNADISPTGRYVLTHYIETRRDGVTAYSSVLTDLKDGRTLLRTAEYLHGSWMPKTDRLYFKRNTDGGTNLVVLDPATMNEQTLATRLPEGSLTLSPTAKFAIISRGEDGPTTDGPLKQLYAPDDRQPGWRDRSALYLVDFANGFSQRLTYGRESVHLNDISPDGKRLLLTRNRHDLTKKPFDHVDVFEMHLEDGRVDTLLTDQAWLDEGSYSPDGKLLLFKGSPSAFGGIGSALPKGEVAQSFDKRLYLYNPATKQATALLKDFAPSVGEYDWNAGDGNIYMRCTDGYDETIWRLDPRTGQRFRFELPVSVVQRFSLSETRVPRAVFFGQTGTTSRNAYVAELSSARPKCKPFGEVSFAGALGDVRVASCTPWSYKRAERDTVAGFYFLPADFDAKKKYPMLVYYYGGCVPTTRELEFHYPLSVLANMGYVVLALEPSGAIGFGEEFAARHINTWGKRSADDIIEATKAFTAAHSYVDAKKIGCMGASYGGFMTEYLQTRTDIFAAAVSHAGISNIASYWGGGYWGHTYGETAQYGSYPWNNPDLYVKQSALFNADKIHTPLLLLHGTADTNVPTNESQQLFTALRILGRPVQYIQIEGANHVVTDYRQRMQWQQTIMAWFAKYLQGDDAWWKGIGYKD